MSETTNSQPETSLSPIDRIIGVIISPRQTFDDIVKNPTWVLPLVLVVLVTTLWGFFLRDLLADLQEFILGQIPGFPADELNKSVENERKYGWTKFLYYMPIGCLIMALLYRLAGNVFLGGESTYKQVFSIVCWSWVVIIVGQTITALIMLVLNDFISPTSLVFIVGRGSISFWFFFFLFADLSHLWVIVVAGIGLSVLYKFSTTKGLMISIGWWLFYLILMSSLVMLPFYLIPQQ